MICSMTGFARAALQEEWGTMTWELRALNLRYFEMSFRLPESFRHLETNLRDIAAQQLKRGKFEATLRSQINLPAGTKYNLNQALIKQLASAAQEVDAVWPNLAKPTMVDVLNWPGVLEVVDTPSSLDEQILSLFNQGLKDLFASRQREGESLARFLIERLNNCSLLANEVAQRIPIVLTQQRARLIKRVEELRLELPSERLEQECLIMVQKMDVSEEIERLKIHIAEAKRLIEKGGVVGRQLDFLLQELNREANTLSSKSSDTAITHHAVDMKVLIEQMREQVQNVE